MSEELHMEEGFSLSMRQRNPLFVVLTPVLALFCGISFLFRQDLLILLSFILGAMVLLVEVVYNAKHLA